MRNTRPSHLVTPRAGTKGASTKRALMDAARHVFASQGYISATVPGIAAQAGKSPATFYKYFANKQDMLETLLTEFVERIDEHIPVPTGGGAYSLDQVRSAVDVYWGVYREFRAEWVAVTQAAAIDVEMVQLWLRIRDRGVRRVLPLVEAAQARGVRLGDPMVVASNMSAMIEHTAYLWLGLEADGIGRPADDAAAVEAIAQQWHRMLGERDE